MEALVRWKGKIKLGWFPLPLAEAVRIRKFLVFPATPFAGLDPCIGDGSAFAAITADATGYRYGIELDAYRAEQAKERVPNTIQGDALEVHCAVESLSCIFCNPPYDWTLGCTESRRTEQVFLNHTYRWLKPGGVLVLVIPGERIAECSQVLASHFRDLRAYRLEAPECVRYKQVVVFGVRRNRRERERLTDADISRARLQCASLARHFTQLPVLPLEPDARYDVPPSGSVHLIYRGLPLDEVEDLLPQSSAYRQAGRILFAEPTSVLGRPLTPLKPGHVGLLAVGGMLNGIFGSGEQRHISFWQAVKVVDKTTEEDEQGVITIREKERFSNELTLVFAAGHVTTLK
jgi:SAM-dependent methyltransferase